MHAGWGVIERAVQMQILAIIWFTVRTSAFLLCLFVCLFRTGPAYTGLCAHTYLTDYYDYDQGTSTKKTNEDPRFGRTKAGYGSKRPIKHTGVKPIFPLGPIETMGHRYGQHQSQEANLVCCNGICRQLQL